MKIYHRHSIRLTGYDYTQNGCYFLTICTRNRECLFGEIQNAEMFLSNIGEKVNDCWQEIPNHFPQIVLHEYVIMPNHIHLLLALNNTGGRIVSAPTVIGSLKRFASRQAKSDIWQKGFYDHVIRDDEDLKIKWDYIEGNPAQWLLNKDEYSE